MSIFKLKGPKKQPDNIHYAIDGVAEFKYYKNPQPDFVENKSGDECVCCGKVSKFIYKYANDLRENLEFVNKHIDKNSDMSKKSELRSDFEISLNRQSRSDVVLCSQCIANGNAAKCFKFEFNLTDFEPCSNADAENEIIYKTPTVFSLQ